MARLRQRSQGRDPEADAAEIRVLGVIKRFSSRKYYRKHLRLTAENWKVDPADLDAKVSVWVEEFIRSTRRQERKTQ